MRSIPCLMSTIWTHTALKSQSKAEWERVERVSREVVPCSAKSDWCREVLDAACKTPRETKEAFNIDVPEVMTFQSQMGTKIITEFQLSDIEKSGHSAAERKPYVIRGPSSDHKLTCLSSEPPFYE